MGKISHTAFLDLEESLASRLRHAWGRYWTPLANELVILCSEGRYDEAHKRADTLDLAPLFDRARPFAQTVGMSALLLGASRLRSIRHSRTAKTPPLRELNAFLNQLQVMLARNATEGLRQLAHEWIDAEEQAVRKAELSSEDWLPGLIDGIQKRERPNHQIRINVAGKNYFALAASVQVSRLSAFGFLLEAVESGVQNYRVDAVLDERTCEVCRHMDGMVFPVEQGLQLAQLIMDTEDPEALKNIAPFYAQNKASLAALPSYTMDDLINEGMHLPPYHPLCRCILTPTDEAAALHPTQAGDRVAVASQTLYGEGDGVRLTRDLFGIEQPDETTPQRIGDVVPDMTPEELEVAQWLEHLITESPEPLPGPQATPEQAAEWIQGVVQDWLAQPSADVPPDALVVPTPFEGTTIPDKWVAPFDPSRLRQLAQSRWPWLAGLLGWLALERKQPPVIEDDAELVAEEELADLEREEREELREDRRP